MDVHVVPVSWETRREALRRVRERVFIEEQQVPREIEWDGQDDDATHFLALTDAGEAVGCARLLPNGQIGRMAVLPARRGTGLGRRILDEVIEEAKRQGFTRVHLHAQTHAVGFYRKAGFLPDGGEFLEAGIPHQSMSLELPIPFERDGSVARPAVREQAAPDHPPARLELYRGETDCLLAVLRCLEPPRRRLAILSQLLDHTLFDPEPVVEAVSRFARSSPSVDVRVLISDSSAIVSRGHRLVELARRLDSRITVLRTAPDTDPGTESFVTWDDAGYLRMPDHQEYAAMVNLHDPVQARRLREHFDGLWARAVPDPELRVLKL